MASRVFPLLTLTAAGIAAIVMLAPAAPAIADEDPYYRVPRTRAAPPPQRVRTVTTTRTVWRTRTRTICYDYNGQPFDCRAAAPTVQRYMLVGYTCGGCVTPAAPPMILQAPVQHYAPAITCGNCATAYVPPPRYYGTGCGGCAPAAAAPPYIYVHSHGYGLRHHGHPHGRHGH